MTHEEIVPLIAELLCAFVPASEAAIVLNIVPQALRKRAHRESIPAICVFGVWLFERHAIEELAIEKQCRLQKHAKERQRNRETINKLQAWRDSLKACAEET